MIRALPRRFAGRRVRFGALAAYLLAALVVGMPVAAAAPDPPSGAVTDIGYDGATLRGVLTLRAGAQDVRVDPGSLAVTVNGATLPATVQASTTIRRAVFLVVDMSGSMDTNGGIDAAKRACTNFLARVPADVQVGLISFSTTARVDLEPTTDREAARTAVARLRVGKDTALYDAVALAVRQIGTAGERSIVVLTDGVDRVSTTNLETLKGAIGASGVRVDVIGFKTGQTDTIGAQRQLAEVGRGTVADAADAAQVDTAFGAAAKALDAQVTWTVTPGALPAGPTTLAVSGTAGGTPFSVPGSFTVAAVPTPLAVAPSSPPPVVVTSSVVSVPLAGLPRLWLFGGLVAVFVGLLGLMSGLLTPALATSRQQRIETIEAYTSRLPHVTVTREQATSALTTSLVGLGDRIMAGRDSTSRTMALLQRADLPWRPGEWAVLRAVSVVLGAAVGSLLLHGDLMIAGVLVGGLLGLLLPAVGLRLLARRRARAFELQMPDILMLVASSLSTGFSLPQALDAVAHDVPQPAGKEFARVMAETRIGADVEDALERMAVRMDSDNMRWTSMAIRIQRQVGGNLADTLRTTAATLREREYLRRHVRALSAEGRLSAYILSALPILMFLYEVNVNREYISLLWTTVPGWIMLITSVIGMGIGIFWMSKAIKVEV